MQQVLPLLDEYPEERLLPCAACEVALRCEPGDFAGSWVLQEVEHETGQRCACRKCYPCRSIGMPVLVENALCCVKTCVRMLTWHFVLARPLCDIR